MAEQDVTINVDTQEIYVTVGDVNINVNISSVQTINNVPADTLLSLNGAEESGTETGFKYNSVTERMEVWVKGVKQNEWGEGAVPW